MVITSPSFPQNTVACSRYSKLGLANQEESTCSNNDIMNLGECQSKAGAPSSTLAEGTGCHTEAPKDAYRKHLQHLLEDRQALGSEGTLYL